MRYLLGIDFGGGASKATLLREDGCIVADSTVEYPMLHPAANACEQSPDDWINALCANTKAILQKSGVGAENIAAVAIDSATHTCVVCDADAKPLRYAIHWTDSRSRAQAEYLRTNFGDEIFEKTYHLPDTIWTLPQLLWIKDNEPDTYSKIGKIFFEKDYIRYFLTGVFCTDHIEAEGSMLFDARVGAWDKSLCDMCGIDMSVLPEIRKPSDVIGEVTEQAASLTGLFAGTPVVCGSTDTVMEIFASGATEKGDMTVKLATAGRICVITDAPYPDRHLVNYSHIMDGLWYPGTGTKAAASSYRWYRDTFGGDYAELDAGAKTVPIGCEGLVFHPYINGELTPYADPQLCASFTGVRATHEKRHFTRAVMEGVCMSLLESKRYLDGLGIEYSDKPATLIGGGAKGEIWRQMTADALGISLVTCENSDSSLGSAMLAGIAVGIFEDATDAARLCVKVRDVVTPNKENTEKYAKLLQRYRKIHDALAPIYREEI